MSYRNGWEEKCLLVHTDEKPSSTELDLLEMLTRHPDRRVPRRMLAGQQEAETHVGAKTPIDAA